MPTTRAARRRARGGAQLIELPADALGLVLYQLTLAHDIAAVAQPDVPCARRRCKARNEGAALLQRGRDARWAHRELCEWRGGVADGRIITGSNDKTVKVWRDGACERTIQAHTSTVWAVAVLPGGARFVSGSDDRTAKLWTLDGALERTFAVGEIVLALAAMPDGVHFVVGGNGEVRLYHVDGTLVHAFEGHTTRCGRWR